CPWRRSSPSAAMSIPPRRDADAASRPPTARGGGTCRTTKRRARGRAHGQRALHELAARPTESSRSFAQLGEMLLSSTLFRLAVDLVLGPLHEKTVQRGAVGRKPPAGGIPVRSSSTPIDTSLVPP